MCVVVAVLLAGCATQETGQRPEEHQAVRDFIAVRELEKLKKMSTALRDSWTSIDDRFIIYRSRRGQYLVEFDRRCYELSDSSRVVPDERRVRNTVYARTGTIRGCRINTIYALTEAEAEELDSLGTAPGSRN
jgi:hypothetical protein